MTGGPPGGLGGPEHASGTADPSSAAPAGGQSAAGVGGGEPPAEPPAAGEQPDQEDGEEYWFSEDDDDEADWVDAEHEDHELEDMLEHEGLAAWEDEFGDEEDLTDDEALVEWGDGGSESSDASEAEEAAWERLEADTAGRFVCPGWASYSIPTVSHHFQSADALALSEAPGPGGGLLAATFDVHGVTVWLLPRAGDIAALGPGQPAVRLGGFQAPRDAYSLAFSPDGRWLALGTEGGLLSLYLVDPLAPPRPHLPPGRLPLLQGLNYFYTPLLLPQQLRQQQRQQAQAAGSDPARGGQPPAGAAGASAPQPPVQPNEQHPASELAPTVADTRAVRVMDLAIDAVQRRLQAEAAERGDSPRQRQLRQAAVSEEVEQNRGFLRAVMGQDMLMLRAALPPAAGGPQLEAAAGNEDNPAVVEHEVAASYRSFMYRAGAAVQLLQAIGQQREAAGAGGSSSAAAEAAAAVAVDAAGEPARGAADGQPQQAERQDKAAGKRPLAAGQAAEAAAQQQLQAHQRSGQAQQQGAPNAAAVQLRGILAVGMDSEQARRVPFLSDGMLNGVRFGMVAGKQRLLAADQSGYVYVLELPSPAAVEAGSSSGSADCLSTGGSDLKAEQLLCPGLGQPSQYWCMRPVNFFRASQHPLGARVQQQQPAAPPRPGHRDGTRAAVRAAAAAAARSEGTAAAPPAAGSGLGLFLSAALGPFPTACNLAAASPDGRWVAVVGDDQAVYLADQSAGFAWRALPFDLAGSRAEVEHGLDKGSQYCAWNASSSLLAVSSDTLHAVFVWEPRSGQLVMRVEGHGKPCLSLGFAPWNDRLLVYAEESRRLHLREVPAADPAPGASSGGATCEQNARDDLADARAGVQLLQLPVLPSAPPPPDPYASIEAMQAQLAIGGRRRRVTGMALSGQGDLLATTRQGELLRYLSCQHWRPEQHRLWPPDFRAAVKALLLCAHRQHKLAGEQPSQHAAGLWLLPLSIMQLVIAAAAGQRGEWLPMPDA